MPVLEGVFEGRRELHGDLISGPGVQVHACEIRSFWQVGVISNGPQTSVCKNSCGDGDL